MINMEKATHTLLVFEIYFFHFYMFGHCFLHVCLHTTHLQYSQRPAKLGTATWCWDLNPDPLGELLIPEPSLRPLLHPESSIN